MTDTEENKQQIEFAEKTIQDVLGFIGASYTMDYMTTDKIKDSF